MKATFTLNGIKKTVNLPVCWEEVTFRQMLLHSKAKDAADVLSAFTNIDAELLRTAKIPQLDTLLSVLSFLGTQKVDYVLPKEILGYKIKDNLEIEEIQRYADLETIIKEFKDNDPANLEKYPLMVATYVVEPYNFRDAENMAPSFFDAPAMEVLAVGNFMQVNMRVLSAIMPTIVRLGALRRNSWRQGMRNYFARLAFTVSFYFLKRRLPPPVRSYLDGRLRSLSIT